MLLGFLFMSFILKVTAGSLNESPDCDVRLWGKMATAGRMSVDGGDMMRYAEYSPKPDARSDADIDRRLASTCCYAPRRREVK